MECKHVVSVPDEVFIGQRRVGLQHSQGKLVIASLQDQGNKNPVNYRATINLQTSVNNGYSETGLGVCGRELPLDEDPNKRRRKVDRLADAKGFHVRIRQGEGPKRSISRLAASLTSMERSVEMCSVALIWWRLDGRKFAQEMVT